MSRLGILAAAAGVIAVAVFAIAVPGADLNQVIGAGVVAALVVYVIGWEVDRRRYRREELRKAEAHLEGRPPSFRILPSEDGRYRCTRCRESGVGMAWAQAHAARAHPEAEA